MPGSRRFYGSVLLVVAAMLAGAGIANAHGGDTSLIHSCVNKDSGGIRIVGATSHCLRSEASLDWNKEGPPGPSSLSVVLRETSRQLTLAPGAGDVVSSGCLSGEVVVGGGPTNIPANVTVAYSTLFFDGTNSGWSVRFENHGASTVTVLTAVSAECVLGTMSKGLG